LLEADVVMRLSHRLSVLLLALAAPRPASADALAPVGTEPVGRVVAAGPGVAVLRRGGVWLLDGEGRVGGRCLDPGPRLDHRRRGDGTARAPEEVLREAGMTDDDESDDAEALVDDEGGGPRAARRTSVAAGTVRALDVAGAEDAAWIGAEDGVWRLDVATGRCVRAGLAGRAVRRVAAAGPLVVAVAGATVWRANLGPFELAAVLPSPVRAAALAGDGTILVADDDGVVEAGPARSARRVLDGRVEALAACGPAVYALAHDGVHRLNGADVERLGPPPPARALACAWPGLLAAGVGLWSSPDGATWTEEAAGVGRSFSDVTFAAGRPWLAGTDGLFVPVAAPAAALLAGDDVESTVRRRAGAPPVWAALRPRVAIVYDDWTESQGRAGWRLWVALTLTLDRHVLARRERDR
jgi:hypothetical protein